MCHGALFQVQFWVSGLILNQALWEWRIPSIGKLGMVLCELRQLLEQLAYLQLLLLSDFLSYSPFQLSAEQIALNYSFQACGLEAVPLA